MPMLALKCSVNVSVGFLPFFVLYNASLSAAFYLLMPSHGTSLAANNELTSYFTVFVANLARKNIHI